MIKFLLAGVLAAVPFASVTAAPATFNGVYSQNFDGLGATGTTLTTLGSGEWTTWRFNPQGSGWGGPTWNDNSGIVAANLSLGTLVDDTSTAQSGQAPLGLFYNAGFPTFTRFGGINAGGSLDPKDSDRSLGTSPTGNAGVALQLALVNNSGGTLNSLSLGYDTTILSAASANNELFGYRFFYSLTGEAGSWVSAPGLDTVTAQADAHFKQYNTAGTLNLAGGWGAGSTLLLRVVDDNDQFTSPDQMLAIDNFSLAAAPAGVPEPDSWAMLILGFGAIGATLRRRKAGLLAGASA